MDFPFGPIDTNPGWDLIKTVSSYYGLRDYLHMWYIERMHPERVRIIRATTGIGREYGEGNFWQQISTGGLLEGQPVRLTGFYLSPWFPRRPGLYWTYSAAVARKRAHRDHIAREGGAGIIFDVYGKTLMSELGGVGCVNFRKDRETVLITATSSGHTERGIPLAIPQTLWQQLSRDINANGTVEVDLVGVISPIPDDYDSYLLRSANIPKLALKVSSILNVKRKPTNTEIIVTPWTIFELQQDTAHTPYGFTYSTHSLFRDDISRTVAWMKNYIAGYDGEVIVTDFDEELNQLNAQFPLVSCLNGSVSEDEVIRYCQRIKNRFDRRLNL